MTNFFKYSGVVRSSEPVEQVKCPSCGSYKTLSHSPRSRTRMIGGALLFLGAFFTVFIITLILGIPLMLAGIVMLVSSFAVKDTKEMRCLACGFHFIKS